MPGFWLRLFVTSCGLLLAAILLPGIAISGLFSLIFASIVFGFINAIIRPIIILLTLPFTLITLGFFVFIINAAMLGLAAYLVPGFEISGFWSAFFGSLVVSITSTLVSWYVGPRGTIEVIIVEHH